MTEHGTYSLLVEVRAPASAPVGALGEVAFEPGWYAYAGSALGPGGFARVRRHHEVGSGVRAGGNWHVDALLGLESSAVDCDVRSVDLDGECAVAAATAGDPVRGFGAADCDCESHLHFSPRRDALLASVDRAHDAAARRTARH